MNNSRDQRKIDYSKNKKAKYLKAYGKQGAATPFSNHVILLIAYGQGGLEHLKNKVVVNLESWQEYEKYGINQHAVEMRKNFYKKFEACQTLDAAYDVMFELALAIVNGEQK